jgi:hypothetical protein
VAYLRFVVADPHPDTGVAAGLFTVAYATRDAGETSNSDRAALAVLLMWFSKNLPIPKRFNRSASKGYYRRNTKGIAWFRDDAHEHISRMHELKTILEANGYIVQIVQEDRIGYIVYKDNAQVIAEPFADTLTGE